MPKYSPDLSFLSFFFPQTADPKLREFMELMKPRSKKAIWANDDTDGVGGVGSGAVLPPPQAVDVVLEDGGGSDDDALYEDLVGNNNKSEEEEDDDEEEGDKDEMVMNTAVSDVDYLKSRMKSNFDSDHDDVEEEEEEEEESEEEGEESEEGDEENEQEEIDDDLENIFNKKNKTNKESATDDELMPTSNRTEQNKEDEDEDPMALIASTGRLFVRNLPYSAAEEDLKAAFEVHGAVADCHIVLDKATRQSKGYALIQFERDEDAVAAFTDMDGSIFMGRLLHILPGHKAPRHAQDSDDDGTGNGGGTDGTSSYKRRKEAELKAAAGNTVAWNSLFMRSDTVAEAVAALYGVSKADLLDPTAPDMAVRLALGETQVIAETKAALAKEGVDVEALEKAAAAAGGAKKGNEQNQQQTPSSRNGIARSDRVLIIKNLPYSTDASELESLLSGPGPLARLTLPPTKTLAIVEYVEPQDARRAFKSLAYKRYQSVPIYLEWAPAGIFNAAKAAKQAAAAVAMVTATATTRNVAAAAEKKKGEGEKIQKAGAVVVEAKNGALAGQDDDAIESTTVYVKNLAFKTEESGMNSHFTHAVKEANGGIRSVKIAKKKTKDGRVVSSGFGFVECSSETVAREVIKKMQGTMLDGHRLVLQLAQQQQQQQQRDAKGRKNKNNGEEGEGKKNKMKIVVRNLAFEATKKDVLGLFTPFGAVKSCRLPQKFDGTHRGFAFVEFSTPQEAKSAVEAVSGTHLYGRRLVIEWAEEDGGLDEIRAKTTRKFASTVGENNASGDGSGENEKVAKKRKENGDGGGGSVGTDLSSEKKKKSL